MNLDLLYQVSVMTGDEKYARLATRQAEQCMRNHIRPNFTTYHVVNYNSQTGQVDARFTWQGKASLLTAQRGVECQVMQTNRRGPEVRPGQSMVSLNAVSFSRFCPLAHKLILYVLSHPYWSDGLSRDLGETNRCLL